MKPSDFYRRQIRAAAERSAAASRAGDLPAFEAAEKDKAAYENMLSSNEKLFDAGGGGVLGKK